MQTIHHIITDQETGEERKLEIVLSKDGVQVSVIDILGEHPQAKYRSTNKYYHPKAKLIIKSRMPQILFANFYHPNGDGRVNLGIRVALGEEGNKNGRLVGN